MGERGSGAAFGAPSRVFLAAAVLACIGPALHARAEGPQAEIVASTTPSAVEPAAAPSDAGKEGQAPAAPAAGEESSIRPPAENTEGDSPASPAVAPASEDVPDPAEDSETATPAPSEGEPADAATAPKPEEAKPAETAAPAAPESEPKQPESATAPPAAPSGTPAARDRSSAGVEPRSAHGRDRVEAEGSRAAQRRGLRRPRRARSLLCRAQRRSAVDHADGLYRAGAGADRRDPECR